jgi:hypothetical protein
LAPTAAAAPNAMALFQLLAALGSNAQPSQAAVANSAQIPNGNLTSNYQGFHGALSNISQPASVSGAVSVCSQPPQASGSGMMRLSPTHVLPLASNSTQLPHAVTTTKLPPPAVVASSTTTASQAPVGGSMNNSQVASLAALLQLIQNRQGQQGLSQGR